MLQLIKHKRLFQYSIQCTYSLFICIQLFTSYRYYFYSIIYDWFVIYKFSNIKSLVTSKRMLFQQPTRYYYYYYYYYILHYAYDPIHIFCCTFAPCRQQFLNAQRCPMKCYFPTGGIIQSIKTRWQGYGRNKHGTNHLLARWTHYKGTYNHRWSVSICLRLFSNEDDAGSATSAHEQRAHLIEWFIQDMIINRRTLLSRQESIDGRLKHACTTELAVRRRGKREG